MRVLEPFPLRTGLTQLLCVGFIFAALFTPAKAAVISWDAAGNGNWSTPGNWTPAGPPDLTDVVMLGNLPAINNADVALDQNDAVAEMHITDGMTFGNHDHTFSVIGDTYISGLNVVPIQNGTAYHYSRVFIRPTPAPVQYSTDDLIVTDEGRVRLYQGGTVEVRGQLSTDNDSSIYGEGQIRFLESGVALVNSGIIDPAGGGIVFNNVNGGTLDLDGSGSGQIMLQWPGEHLTINGGILSDPFSGEILVDGDASLQMNLDAPWIADAGSVVRFGWVNNGIDTEPSIIGGTEVAIGGLAEVSNSSHGRFDAAVTYAESANVDVSHSSRLEMNAATLVEGGVFSLLEDAEVDFDGPTTVHGGNFSTFSNTSSDGAVRFNGETTWAGIVTIDGIALQVGDAAVNGLSNIQADVLDMDGLGNTVWDFNHILTLGAASIDSTISNTFDGVMQLDHPFSRLNLQLTGGMFDKWTMNGEMDLAGSAGPGAPIRVDGSTMRVTGELNTNGRVRIAASAEFGAGGEFNFADADAALWMEAETLVEAGATFVGDGTLQNQVTGQMTLADGATLDDVGLVNGGLLEVGNSPGAASVDRFENTADGTWLLEIGGHVAGSEHDLLVVSDGPTLLDGSIEVDLIDAGNGLFLPEIGDEFTVLTSVGDQTGMFVDDPVSLAAGHSFQWEVLYHPHDVTLKLVEINDIVPEPATFALLGMCLASLVTRSRSQALTRSCVCILATIVTVQHAQPSHAADGIWISNVDGAYWSDSGNWAGGIVPGNGDHADVGSSAAAENTYIGLDQQVVLSSLSVTDGMTILNRDLMNNLYPLTVFDDALVSGTNDVGVLYRSTIRIIRGDALFDFNADNLTLDLGGNLDLLSGIVRIDDRLTTTSTGIVEGKGVINFVGTGTTLVNDGTIDPHGDELTLNQAAGGIYDLDGIGGAGRLRVNGSSFTGSTPDQMTVNGTALSDSFSGQIYLRMDSALNMNLTDGWTADSSSEIYMRRRNGAALPARITGSLLNLGGTVFVTDAGNLETAGSVSRAAFDAEVTLQDSAEINVELDNVLDFNSTTEVRGTFLLAEDAEVNFDGPTTVHGGNFSTFSNTSSDGAVRFNGETTWAGIVTIDGIALQVGDAAVNGLSNIQADVLDMDGLGNTVWDFNHILTLGAASIDSTISNTFDGVMQLDHPFSRLNLQLTNSSFDKWTMNGEMDLAGSAGPGAPLRVDGSTMRVTGELNTNGRVRIAASAEFGNGGEFNFADADAALWMEAETLVEAGATFVGDGTLQNQVTGQMTLADGATLDDVGLVNGGLLEVGNSPGAASVDRFENTADGTWLLEIGGHVAGSEHDLLVVSDGPTLLDGSIEVDLIDAGSGLFLPEIGDEFTVLTSVGDQTGVFLDDPVSFAAGHSFQWEVLYHPHDVTLRLLEIGDLVPEPTTTCLALFGCLLAAAVRQRS